MSEAIGPVSDPVAEELLEKGARAVSPHAWDDDNGWSPDTCADVQDNARTIAGLVADAMFPGWRERSAEERLQDALAAAGEAIEAMPWDYRFEAVSRFLDEHPIDRPEAFLMGVAVVAHQMRLDREMLAADSVSIEEGTDR